MPQADNKADRDRSEKQVAGASRALAERRDAVITAMTTARETSHAAERAKETAAQTAMMANRSQADRAASESIFAAQRERLEMRQRAGLELMKTALDAASRLEHRGPEGQLQAKAILDQAADANGATAARDRMLLTAERDALRAALEQSDGNARKAQIEDLARAQRDAKELLTRDLEVARAEVERREALASLTLDNEQRDRLQAAVIDSVKNDRLRDLVTTRLIQDLVNEALCPGREVAAKFDEKAAMQRVKGVIAEQIAVANLRDEVEAENRIRKDRHLFVIEGDRIRDENRNKISDGIAVWRDQENRLQIWKALEVKGGRDAARDLVYKVERLSQAGEQELRKYARDLARDKVTEAKLTGEARRQAIDKLAVESETALRSREAQKESGQPKQTAERLDVAERIYVEGKAERIAIDRERRLTDLVRSVTVDEALRNNQDVQRLGVRTKDLDAIAKAFVDELLRQRSAV